MRFNKENIELLQEANLLDLEEALNYDERDIRMIQRRNINKERLSTMIRLHYELEALKKLK